MQLLIPIALLGWIPVSTALFVLLPSRRTVVASIIGAWLLLPPASIPLFGLPDYDKMMAATVGILLGTLIFQPNRLSILSLMVRSTDALLVYRPGLSQEGGFPGGSLWTIPLEMCSIVGELTPISIDGGSPMSTITQRIASAFVVLCGRYGDVTKMAHDREQSRQSLYREASQVANAVDGTAVQSRIDELQRQLAGQQAQIQDLQERLEHAIEITRDKQDEFASVAQAEGVSLSVARRLLQVVAGSVTTPSVPTLGRATEEAGQRAGQLLEVLDEVAQPKVKQATADEIFLGPNRS